jgi:hypothetical protein
VQALKTIEQQPKAEPSPAPLRSIREIVADLQKDIPERFIRTRRQGNQDIAYIEWHTAVKFMDYYAPGWECSITSVLQVASRVVITMRITVPALEGAISREASGSEEVDTKGYGDAISNSEQMAFKRACARFGLGIGLYAK